MTQEALKLALEALKTIDEAMPFPVAKLAQAAIEEALAQPDPYKQGYTDAMNWKVQNHLEHLPTAQPEQDTIQRLSALVRAQQITIDKLEAQPEQEPVAWMHNHIKGNVIAHRPTDIDRHPERWTALYPEPKPCPTCEALARTVMLDQTSHDTTPPQRTWVGLTDEEIEAKFVKCGGKWNGDQWVLEDADLHPFVRTIESPELNTLRAISDEYNAWIKHHAAGHSYDDFLAKRKAAHGIKE